MISRKERFVLANLIKKHFFVSQSLGALADREAAAHEDGLSVEGKRLLYFTFRHLSSFGYYLNIHYPKWRKKSSQLAFCFLFLALEERIFQRKDLVVVLKDLQDGLKQAQQIWLAKVFDALCHQLPESVDDFFQTIRSEIAKHPLTEAYIDHLENRVSWEGLYGHPPLWVSLMPWAQPLSEEEKTLVLAQEEVARSYYLAKNSPSFKDRLQQGELFYQNIASQTLCKNLSEIITERFRSESSLKILDACAAPGGKTLGLIKGLSGEKMQKVSFSYLLSDKHTERLEACEKLLTPFIAQLDTEAHFSFFVQDWSLTPSNDLATEAQNLDLIMIDAPCSGSGVIRKHPDILWKEELPLDSLVSTQRSLLSNLSSRLGDNGVLVYSTCSHLPQENIEVIEWFLENHTMFEELAIAAPQRARPEKRGFFIEPHQTQDGLFWCVLVKKPKS